MQPACSVGPLMRCHLVWEGMGGTVSWIVFLQIGCGVIPVSQFQLCSEALGHGMVAESLGVLIPLAPAVHPQVTRPFFFFFF